MNDRDRRHLEQVFCLPVSEPLEKALFSGFNLACALWIEAGEELPEHVKLRYMRNIQGDA